MEVSTIAVAPLVGAWIEILSVMATPPTAPVAPLVGAWIEILYLHDNLHNLLRRSSCRSVD